MTGKTNIQMEPIVEMKNDDVSPEKHDRPQKLRRKAEDDDIKAAKLRSVGEGVGPGRKSKACECFRIWNGDSRADMG